MQMRAAIKVTWASLTPQQGHRLIISTDEEIHVKGVPNKYPLHSTWESI